MFTYHCDGFRPIPQGFEDSKYRTVDDSKAAAWMFAARMARREFGKRGYCRTLRLDSRAMDGSYVNYEVFIGVRCSHDLTTTAGHNVWLTIYIRGED